MPLRSLIVSWRLLRHNSDGNELRSGTHCHTGFICRLATHGTGVLEHDSCVLRQLHRWMYAKNARLWMISTGTHAVLHWNKRPLANAWRSWVALRAASLMGRAAQHWKCAELGRSWNAWVFDLKSGLWMDAKAELGIGKSRQSRIVRAWDRWVRRGGCADCAADGVRRSRVQRR